MLNKMPSIPSLLFLIFIHKRMHVFVHIKHVTITLTVLISKGTVAWLQCDQESTPRRIQTDRMIKMTFLTIDIVFKNVSYIVFRQVWLRTG